MKIKNPYPMSSRSYFALALIALSLISALLIVKSSERSTLVWSAQGDLAIGEKLGRQNLKATRVLLPENLHRYTPASTSLLGKVVIRPIAGGELIPKAALSLGTNGLLIRSLPLQVLKNDLPADLVAGELVDIYSLPQRSAADSANNQVSLVGSGLRVESIDNKARDLGGAIGIVLALRENLVLPILAETANARIVVVRSA